MCWPSGVSLSLSLALMMKDDLIVCGLLCCGLFLWVKLWPLNDEDSLYVLSVLVMNTNPNQAQKDGNEVLNQSCGPYWLS